MAPARKFMPAAKKKRKRRLKRAQKIVEFREETGKVETKLAGRHKISKQENKTQEDAFK